MLHGAPAQAAPLPSGLSPVQAAHALEEAIRSGQPVPYNGNVVVEAVAENRRRDIFIKSTDAPLVYDPDPAVPGDDEYFRLPLSRKKPLRVRPIPAEDIIAVKRVPVVKGHPPLTAVSHLGVVTVQLGLFPSVMAHLSNGSHMILFVGVTTFVTEHVER